MYDVYSKKKDNCQSKESVKLVLFEIKNSEKRHAIINKNDKKWRTIWKKLRSDISSTFVTKNIKLNSYILNQDAWKDI